MKKWCIVSKDFDLNEIYYLGWQNPAYNESGYFWTSKEVIKKIAAMNNTIEHPFLFDSKWKAIKHLKSINIPQKCHFKKINI